MKLRKYQQDAHAAIFKEWETVTSTLVVLPTGSGKTVLFADVIRAVQPTRALVIAHREELIWQARDKIVTMTGLECGIEMGELYVNNSLFGDVPVVISTVQTQTRRMSRFRPTDFGLLIVDESHHACADTYRNLINYYCQNPALKVLAVTATPDRADEEALGQIFETVAFDYEILDAIHDGWLVPVDQQFVHIAGLDFSAMRTTAGDLNGADLAAVMEAERNLHGVATASVEIIGKRRAIVFTASVKQAEMMSEILNRHREGMADWVCGKTDKDTRREMLERFKRGDLQVVVNCGVLTEGFDDPGVEVIVMARPTKSRALYAQMSGRSTRPLPGLVDGVETADARKEAIRTSTKPSCLIVDFVGNSGRHKLMTAADILGGNVSDEAVERAIVEVKKKGGAVRVDVALDGAEEDIQEELKRRRQAEEARKSRLVAGVRYNTKFVNPFDAMELMPVRDRGWDNGRHLSDKQKALLLKQSIDPDAMSYAQGKQVIGELFKRWNNNLCTVKQSAVLKRYGYETKNMSRTDASLLLSGLARNGWKKNEPVTTY